CKVMNQYREAVGKLNPSLNSPYDMLNELPEVLAFKGMGAGAGGYVGIISKDPDTTKQSIPWEVLDWAIDYDGVTMVD
ncbi:MAG: hypothetical protein ACPG9O_03425, partial [Candidatus Poseidoniaceae archaeon]